MQLMNLIEKKENDTHTQTQITVYEYDTKIYD